MKIGTSGFSFDNERRPRDLIEHNASQAETLGEVISELVDEAMPPDARRANAS